MRVCLIDALPVVRHILQWAEINLPILGPNDSALDFHPEISRTDSKYSGKAQVRRGKCRAQE